MCRGDGAGCAIFSLGDEAVLFIYVSSGLVALADSSLHLYISSTSSLEFGKKTGAGGHEEFQFLTVPETM